MVKFLVVLGLALSALLAAPGFAQTRLGGAIDMQALRTAVRADKKALVKDMLELTNAEAKKFWPLYDVYQRHVDSSNQRRVVAVEGLIATDRASDLYARTLANELIASDEAEIKARRTLQSKLLRALPAKKAARYLQLESKIRAVLAYDIAANIPLIK